MKMKSYYYLSQNAPKAGRFPPVQDVGVYSPHTLATFRRSREGIKEKKEG